MGRTEGYVLIAANSEHYLELAVSAACSLRHNDNRPVALLISGGLRVPSEYLPLFDTIVAFDPPAPFDGIFVRRFVLEKYTPYARAMHVDADCLLIRNDISRFWKMFHGRPFGVMAQRQETGTCYGGNLDVDAIKEAGLADSVFVTNWGVFYYENTGDNPVMAKARGLLEKLRDREAPAKISYFSRPGALSDEPVWAIALAQSGVDIPQHDYQNLLQLTSPNTADYEFDYSGHAFRASKGGLKQVTGQFFHFAELRPLEHYLDGVVFYRRAVGIALPALVDESGKRIDASEWCKDVAANVPRLTKDGRAAFSFVSAV